MDREKYLRALLPKHLNVEKYRSNFEKYATYMGNGVYSWKEILTTNTSHLFLMGVLHSEKIDFKHE